MAAVASGAGGGEGGGRGGGRGGCRQPLRHCHNVSTSSYIHIILVAELHGLCNSFCQKVIQTTLMLSNFQQVYTCTSTCTVRVKKSPVSVPVRSVFLPVSTVPVRSVPFRSVPFRSVPFRSVHFRSNRLPQANSFSARHEFVCKIHCVRWRSIARLFSTTRSRDGFFLP